MKHKGTLIVAFIVAIGLYTSCQLAQPKLRIAVASSMAGTMTDLAEKFEEQHQFPCELSIASSGNLFAQIQAGAPYDVFLSADMFYPWKLENKGLSIGPTEVYHTGKLALASYSMTLEEMEHWRDTSEPLSTMLALANPEVAPYGNRAELWLDCMGIVVTKVNGESVAQVNQILAAKATDLVLTSHLSLNKSQEGIGKCNVIELNDSCSVPIEHGVLVLKSTKLEEKARKFVEFLLDQEL